MATVVGPYYSRAEDVFSPPEPSKIFPSAKSGNPSRRNGASPNAVISRRLSSPSASRAVLDSSAVGDLHSDFPPLVPINRVAYGHPLQTSRPVTLPARLRWPAPGRRAAPTSRRSSEPPRPPPTPPARLPRTRGRPSRLPPVPDSLPVKSTELPPLPPVPNSPRGRV